MSTKYSFTRFRLWRRSLIILLIGITSSIFAHAQDESANFCNSSDVQQVSGHGRAFAMSLNPDSELLAVSNEEGVSLYDTQTLEEISRFADAHLPSMGGLAVAWSPNGDYIAAYIAPKIGTQIWDIKSRQLEKTLVIDADFQHNNQSLGISTLAWSPDSVWLAVVGGLPQKVWDVNKQQVVFEPDTTVAYDYGFGYEDILHSLVTWSPDGEYLAISDESDIRIWHTKTWDETQTLNTSMSSIYSLDWAESGVLAVSGNSFIVELWDTSTWETLEPLQPDSDTMQYIYSLKWSPDGTVLAMGAYNIMLWDREREEFIDELPDQGTLVYDIEWLSQATQLISRNRDGNIYFWDVTDTCVSKTILSTTEPRQAQ